MAVSFCTVFSPKAHTDTLFCELFFPQKYQRGKAFLYENAHNRKRTVRVHVIFSPTDQVSSDVTSVLRLYTPARPGPKV